MRFILLLCALCFNAIAQASDVRYDFIVDASGKGDFKTVQAALDAVPSFRKQTTTIFIRNGSYYEKLVLAESKQMVSLIGESLNGVVLYYDDFAQKLNRFGEQIGTSGSSGFFIYGTDFTAENITFSNTAGPVGQAVAVFVAGDRAFFKNCRFLGFQDTLYTYGKESRQYYLHCYIEGTVDFIFGSSTALFDSCEIKGKKGGYFTAASTPEGREFGYVFRDCALTADAQKASYMLGRPWRPFAKTVFIRCSMTDAVKPEGWDHWGDSAKQRTAYYAEFESKGPGAAPAKRVSWSHQLTSAEAENYTTERILGGWKPRG